MTKKKGSAGGEKFSRGAEDRSRRRYLKVKNCCCTKETDLLMVVFTIARAWRVSTGIHLPCS